MAAFRRMKPPAALYLVLFECGAFRVKATERAALDSARFEGADGVCCGTKGHCAEVVPYDRRRPVLAPKRGKQTWAPLVIDGGKAR